MALEYGFTEKEKSTYYLPERVYSSFGRDVRNTVTEHDLGKEIHSISATKIRAEMREQGDL